MSCRTAEPLPTRSHERASTAKPLRPAWGYVAEALQTRRAKRANFMNLPKHKCGLYLTHNEYRDYYQKPDEWIESNDQYEWKDDAAKQRAIDTGEVWTLQWYPNTPIGFNAVAAPTLEELLAFANDGEIESASAT